jgi:hypothetical protein
VNKATRAEIMYESDPDKLLPRLLEAFQKRMEAGTAHLPPQADG